MERIYHYTSINSLAYILKNREIKLTRLDHVNDPDEGITEDWGDLSKLYFVTCWTNNAKENIALWNMYTPNMRGVRISLSDDCLGDFRKDFAYQKFIHLGGFNCIVLEEGDIIKVYVVLKYPFTSVTYLRETEFKFPEIYSFNEMEELSHTLSLGKIGITKRDYWTMENENRYRIQFLPIELYREGKMKTLYDHVLPFDHLFCEIQPERFKNMEVRLGPKCEESDYILVQSLLEKYNPEAKLERSYIRIK